MKWSSTNISALASLTMCAFAGNSILCRLALQAGSIDAVSFSCVRIFAAALLLTILLFCRRSRPVVLLGSWPAGGALVGYVLTFSWAYNDLTAGTGALLLFSGVQVTMIVAGLWAGERLGWLGTAGAFLLVVGLIFCLLPNITTPSLGGAAMMLFSGLCWGVYSLLGRGNDDPLAATTGNFIRGGMLAVLVALVVLLTGRLTFAWQGLGVRLGIWSGAVTSGLGYVLWYSLVVRMPAVKAALLQLTVPVLAAVGGIIFLGEPLTLRWAISAMAVLAGICAVFIEKYFFVENQG